jgi:hypothetical protein
MEQIPIALKAVRPAWPWAAGIMSVFLLAGACKIVEGNPDAGSDADVVQEPDGSADAADLSDFEVNPDPEAAALFEGTWAQLHVVSHISNFPGYNAVATVSQMWQLVEIEALDTGLLSMTETMCELLVDTPAMPVDTIVPDAFVASLHPTTRSGAVDGSEPGSLFESDVMTEVRGCALDDPLGEELPYAPEDERVIDQDGDGHPGMTLNFTGAVNAAVYVTQRWDSRFYGGVVEDLDHLSGYVESHSEQQILEATNPVLDGTDPDSPDLGSWPDPDPEHSYFELVRLAAGAGCDEVLALGLIPREP